jgi:transcriptional regulator with XRE-family HTH domain
MRLSMTDADPADDFFDIDSAVGARLRARRLDLGKTEWDLGYEMGASGGQVLAWETGQMQMSAGELWLAAQALDVPLAWFFEDLDGATPQEGVAELSLHRMFARLPKGLKAALLELVQSVAGEPDRSATLH